MYNKITAGTIKTTQETRSGSKFSVSKEMRKDVTMLYTYDHFLALCNKIQNSGDYLAVK
jgi:hypothetical protein